MRHRILLLLLLLGILTSNATYVPMRVVAQGCSDEAELIDQILDPASNLVAPEASFTVSWTLLNSGDCTWDRNYRLIFVDGERMNSPRTLRLRNAIEPGNTLTLSLELTAPSDVDNYSGTWRLRNPGGDTFGPELTLDIEVGAGEMSTTEVVLPEVLAFGGMGAGDDPNVIGYCAIDGALPEEPMLLIDYESLDYSYTSLYLCSLPEGAEVTVTVTDPEGNVFSRDFVEDAAVTGEDFDGNLYTGTVLQVNLAFLKQSPKGEWTVEVIGEAMNANGTFILPDASATFINDEEYPTIDNWPTAPIDPFSASAGCNYNYFPGQEMIVSGEFLPADSTLQLGFYHDRMNRGYLAEQIAVQTDGEGRFEIPYAAFAEPGNYNMVLLQEVNPEGYSENGAEYDFGFGGGETAFTCLSVVREESDQIPWRLTFAAGGLNSSEVQVLDLDTGIPYYPTFTNEICDASEPTWWPDGEWILYQSTCVWDTSGDYTTVSAGENYDLYVTMLDPTYLIPDAEKIIQLTATLDMHETEPDSNADGLIVYRQTPVGESLDASGELSILDIFEETDTLLNLSGRAPTWSPDGSRIAFMSDLDGSWQIYVYDYIEEDLWLVSTGCETHCRLPAWSPDGKHIIYHLSTSLRNPTPVALWIANVEGDSKPRRYVEGQYGRATWSNEGWIAFQGPGGIYRATPGRRPVVERYLYSDPDVETIWAPDWSR